MAPKKEDEFSCQMNTFEYYKLCAIGGAIACGFTHTLVTPLDLVKCRLQVHPDKYKNIFRGFSVSYADGGSKNLVKGWAPTFLGYSIQGSVKFAGYEYFKHLYADMVGEENAYLYRTFVFLAASASAEMFADVGLAPFEAMKVRMQTSICFPTLRNTFPRMREDEGYGAFYRGIVPLWGRQVPYTMMKFSSFEKTVEYIYSNWVPKKREECTKGEQLLVTFTAGYIAGVLCAIVSHPADTIVSKLNKDPNASIGGILNQTGFFGIWRGLLARIIMIGTLTGSQWFIYDGFKVYTRMPRPPPADMPESLKKKMKK